MIMKVVFDNGEWFVGNRGVIESLDETHDCHHFKVIEGILSFRELVGKEIAVHTSKPLYFELNYKGEK